MLFPGYIKFVVNILFKLFEFFSKIFFFPEISHVEIIRETWYRPICSRKIDTKDNLLLPCFVQTFFMQ